MFNLFKKKENVEITVIDDNKQLPDFRKISVPDLKQYLVNGYEEIRQVRNKKEELQKKYEDALEYKKLYETTLLTLEEFEKRDNENKNSNERLSSKLNSALNESYNLREEINNYKLKQKEIEKELLNIEKIKVDKRIDSINQYKKDLIEEINNSKGNLSKSKIINLIENIDY